MIKTAIRGLVLVAAIGAAHGLLAEEPAASPARRYDVSTDEGVVKALAELKGWNLSGDRCPQERLAKGTIVLVSTFAYDYGCMAEGYFADGYWVESRETSAPALKALGWSDRAKREAIALQWAGAMTAPGGLSARGKDTPSAKLQADGSVIVLGWNVEPVGMVPVETSRKMRITFSDAGDATTKVLKTASRKLR